MGNCLKTEEYAQVVHSLEIKNIELDEKYKILEEKFKDITKKSVETDIVQMDIVQLDIQDKNVIDARSNPFGGGSIIEAVRLKKQLLKDKYGMNEIEIDFWVSSNFDKMNAIRKSPYDYKLLLSYINNPFYNFVVGYTLDTHVLTLIHKHS